MRSGFAENSFLITTAASDLLNLQYQLVVIIDTARNCANYMKLVSHSRMTSIRCFAGTCGLKRVE